MPMSFQVQKLFINKKQVFFFEFFEIRPYFKCFVAKTNIKLMTPKTIIIVIINEIINFLLKRLSQDLMSGFKVILFF